MESRPISVAEWSAKLAHMFGRAPADNLIDTDELQHEPPLFRDWAAVSDAYMRSSSTWMTPPPSYNRPQPGRPSVKHRRFVNWHFREEPVLSPAVLANAAPSPSQTLAWDDVMRDMQRAVLHFCDLQTRSRLARTCTANAKYAISLPHVWRTQWMTTVGHARAKRVVYLALRAFHHAGILRCAALSKGLHASITRDRIRLWWSQKWGKPCNRVRMLLIIYADGAMAGQLTCGRRLALKINGWMFSDDEYLDRPFLPRFLAWPLAASLGQGWNARLCPWATVKDFILDPGRFV